MKKLLSSALVSAVLLAGIVAQSKAAVFTYTLQAGFGTATWTDTGVAGSNSDFRNLLGPTATNGDPLSTPTVLKYGNDFSDFTGAFGTEPGQTTTYAATPVSFDFTFASGADTHNFTVTGQLDGTLGFDAGGVPFSQAHVTYLSMTDITSGATSFLSVDPNNGLGALQVSTMINGLPFQIWLDRIQSKAAPGDFVSQVGFVNVVPEPSSVAFLFGAVASGSLLIWRKRSR